MKRIGLLGCGTIGTAIAVAIDDGTIPRAELTQVYDISRDAAEGLTAKLSRKPTIMENPHLLSSGPVDIVVEAASQGALTDVALSIIQNRRDLMVMSVGALLDESVRSVIFDAVREYGVSVYVPTGAIAGMDGIRAVRDELDTVTLTTTKHPDSLRGAPFFDVHDAPDIDSIDAPTTIFEGPAVDAVSLFPTNINVAAILSLSGIGGNRTIVRVVADPAAVTNTHMIEAAGEFGRMQYTIENRPSSENPRTSRLALLAAIDMLRGYCSDEGLGFPCT